MIQELKNTLISQSILKPLEQVNKEQVLKHIIILPELQAFIPPLDADTLQQLESAILSEGVRDSIILWKTTHHKVGAYKLKVSGSNHHLYSHQDDIDCYVVIDGHNRYGICQKHNIEFPYICKDFADIEAVKDYMAGVQTSRRNITKELTSYYRGREYRAAKKAHGGLREASTQNEYLPENKKTVEVLAAKYNTSAATIQRDEAFANGLDLLTDDLKKSILSGKIKIDKQTIYNLPKAFGKFPEKFPIETEKILHQVYGKYREVENKAALPVSKPLPEPAVEQRTEGLNPAYLNGISNFKHQELKEKNFDTKEEKEVGDLIVKLMKSEAKVRELETANKNLQADLDFQNHFIENWNREEEVAKLKSKIEVLLNENEEVCNKANRIYEEIEKLKDEKEYWYSIAEKNSANYIKLQNEIKQQQAKKGK